MQRSAGLLGAIAACIVFPPGEPTIRLALIVTVLASIFAHGLSAAPGIQLYARKIASQESP